MTKDEFKATAAENASMLREKKQELDERNKDENGNKKKTSIVESALSWFLGGLAGQMDRAAKLK